MSDRSSSVHAPLKIAALCEALAALQHCAGFEELLAGAVRLLHDAGAPAHLAACMRDPVTGLWQLAALVAADGHPVPIDERGSREMESTGFRAPGVDAATPDQEPPLPELLTNPIGLEVWRRIRVLGGSVQPTAVPVAGEGCPGAILLAVPLVEADRELVTAVLRHAALATDRMLAGRRRTRGQLLSPQRFEERAQEEIERARRYNRELALLLIRISDPARACQTGDLAAAQIRRWDVAGFLFAGGDEFGIVMPETDRGGALGFLNRWRENLAGAAAGLALYPGDGRSLHELTGLARMRSTPVSTESTDPEAAQARGTRWLRGAPAGLGPETVLCPSCLQPYSRAWQRQADRSVGERDRVMAREWLAAACPAHGEQITVRPGVLPAAGAADLRMDAPAMALIARLQRQDPPAKHSV